MWRPCGSRSQSALPALDCSWASIVKQLSSFPRVAQPLLRMAAAGTGPACSQLRLRPEAKEGLQKRVTVRPSPPQEHKLFAAVTRTVQGWGRNLFLAPLFELQLPTLVSGRIEKDLHRPLH